MLVELILLSVMRISLNAAIATTQLASALSFRFTNEDIIFYLLDVRNSNRQLNITDHVYNMLTK